MYLTITSTAEKATDLGFLLHKNPSRAQSFTLPVGVAHVFYPEATDERCTVALLLEVDPVGLVRGRRFSGDAPALAQYVNDRPYAASSMLAVALGRVFRTAMTGTCAARPDLEGASLPLEIHVPAVPSDGGPGQVSQLFTPLGWSVEARSQPLDPEIGVWGDSLYVDLHLRGSMPLDQALSHLYVLLPVLGGAKHYWVTVDEVDKLLRAAGGWLPQHPARELITRRYLAYQRSFVTEASDRLTAVDSADETAPDAPVEQPEEPHKPLGALRREAVLRELRAANAARVVDLGCGEGALLNDLLADPSFTEVLGVDVSAQALDRARRRLGLERMPDTQRARLSLLQSSLTYRDGRLAGFDAAVLMEVIEHLDLPRLPALERSVFAAAQPRTVIVTTPNADYNIRYENLEAGTMRHRDHRFEWGRDEFQDWADRTAAAHGYAVRYAPVGDVDPVVGPSTQLAVFTRLTAA